MTPTIRPDRCTACNLCVRDCPYGVLSLADGAAVAHSDRYCCACGHCVAVCPEDAVALPDRPTEIPGALPSAEAVEALMAARRSVRFFRSAAVPRTVVERLLAAAARAPSGCNARAASVTVIVDPFLLKAIRRDSERIFGALGRLLSVPGLEAALQRAPGAAARRLVAPEVVDAARSMLAGGADHRDWVTHGAPALVLFHARSDRPTPAEDCCVAADHVTLLAPTLGLGTCWNGFVVEAVNALPWLRWRARLPRGERVYAALSLGRPAVKYPRPAPPAPLPVRYV